MKVSFDFDGCLGDNKFVEEMSFIYNYTNNGQNR